MKTTRSLYFLFTFSNARINAFFVRYVDLKATNKERRRHVVLGWGPHVGVVFVACSLAKNLHLSVEFYLQTLETMMNTMRQHRLGSVATIHLCLSNCHFKLWRKACHCIILHWYLSYACCGALNTTTSRTTYQPMKWVHKLLYLPEFGALQLPHHSH